MAVPPPDTIIGPVAQQAASSPPLGGTTYLFSAAGFMSILGDANTLALGSLAVAVCTFIAGQIWALVRHRRESRAAAVQLEIDELQRDELRRRRDEALQAAAMARRHSPEAPQP